MSQYDYSDVKRMSESMSVGDLHSLLDERDHLRARLVEVERERDGARIAVAQHEEWLREQIDECKRLRSLLAECLQFVRDAYDDTSPVGLRAREIREESNLP